MRRVHLLVSAAYIRIVMDIPRVNDARILRTLGPHLDGPWTEYLRKEAGPSRTLVTYPFSASLQLNFNFP